MKTLKKISISGKEVLPLIEGGKGVSATNGMSSGSWAAAGGVGTISGVNADSYDENGNIVPQIYKGKTREERHREMIEFGVAGAIAQVKRAHEIAGGEGRIHLNVLWEMGGAVEILTRVLENTKGMIHGVTCGAGMPYKVSEIAEQFGIYYYPIVSSSRAFRALWLRAYKKVPNLLGGVVYEDPWLAGGHNGLSNSEDPLVPEDPYPRVAELRKQMREYGLDNVPIVMAGGVWNLSEWENWIDNEELGPIAFQFGSRPLLTKESPIPDGWKQGLLALKEGDINLNKFSPTGFYSSAVRNDFLKELQERSERQIAFAKEATDDKTESFKVSAVGAPVYVTPEDLQKATAWKEAGFTSPMRTPDQTMIFVEPATAKQIRADQTGCMGCLSACHFSNWSQGEEGSIGRLPDPRSFCIQKTLQSISHGGDINQNLMFSGHQAYRFATDPLYKDGNIPTVKELVEAITEGK